MPVPPSSPVVTYADPAPTDEVSFSIVCQPSHSTMTVDEFRKRVSASAIDDLIPDPATVANVADQLHALGFEVYDPSLDHASISMPIVVASGSVARFQEVFGSRLTRMTRRTFEEHSPREVTAIVVASGSHEPQPDAITHALLVAVSAPPLLASTPPGPPPPICLDLRNGVAGLTRATATNMLALPSGKMATGDGVRVAVVDSGFHNHAYFAAGGYHITRVSSWGAGNPAVDPHHHGTAVLANLLACAPGVDAWGVKFVDVNAGIYRAQVIPKVRVISLSWCYDISANPMTPSLYVLQLQILFAVLKQHITVVVASGNWSGNTFPAVMREVVAVGGVAFDQPRLATAWLGTTAFAFSGARAVPDLCGIASQINVPLPPIGANPATMQCVEGETSCATAQVAGVAALLLQKNSSLTPTEVKKYLMAGASDVTAGSTFSGQPAGPGKDAATGSGFVDALHSWQLVP